MREKVSSLRDFLICRIMGQPVTPKASNIDNPEQA
jgi:hypothetical protein